jgi:hypothetical protein
MAIRVGGVMPSTAKAPMPLHPFGFINRYKKVWEPGRSSRALEILGAGVFNFIVFVWHIHLRSVSRSRSHHAKTLP